MDVHGRAQTCRAVTPRLHKSLRDWPKVPLAPAAEPGAQGSPELRAPFPVPQFPPV